MLNVIEHQTVASQGYYFIVRYYNGKEKGMFVTQREAIRTAEKWGSPGFQVVRISLR